MIKTTLAGRPTSRLGLGCGRLIGGASLRSSRKIVEQAIALGITHFDVAPSYGMGLAEDVIGDVLGNETEITIATKVGQGRPAQPGLKVAARSVLRPLLTMAPGMKARLASQLGKGIARNQFAPDDVERSFADSLRRLRRDVVDALLLHQPDSADITTELASTMQGFLTAGNTRAIGAGTGEGQNKLTSFGSVSQFRLDLKAEFSAGKDIILHGALRHYPRPERLLEGQLEAFRELGREPNDVSDWVGILLTLALSCSAGSIILVSSSSPERLRKACTAIDWQLVDQPTQKTISMMVRALGIK